MEKREKNFLIVSIITNILISTMVIIACIMMYTGFKFMSGFDISLEVSKSGMLRLFTVDSNILMGIIAIALGMFAGDNPIFLAILIGVVLVIEGVAFLLND